MFGDTPMAIPLSFENTKFPAIEKRMETLKKNREEALAAHELARTHMIERRRSSFIPFKLWDCVWLDTRNLKRNHHKKIGPKREGLFKIVKVIGPVKHTNWGYLKHGRSTTCFMPRCFDNTKKPKFMKQISTNPHLNWSKEKKCMRWRISCNIGKEEGGINIMSNGKATQFRTPCGNRQRCSLMTGIY